MSDRYVRDWRPEDAAAFANFPVEPTSVPLPAWTALVHEEPVACAGLWIVRPKLGEAWAIFRQPIVHGVWIAREMRRRIDGMLANGGFRRIQMTVRLGAIRPERLAIFLGMQNEGCLRAYGDDGADHWMYGKTKPSKRRQRRGARGRWM